MNDNLRDAIQANGWGTISPTVEPQPYSPDPIDVPPASDSACIIDASSSFAGLLTRSGQSAAVIASLPFADQRANVVEWAQRDPANILLLVEAIGNDLIAAAVKAKRHEVGAPMPRKGIVSIEATFGDRGPSKAKRTRPDRIAARFDVSLQVSTTKDRGVSSPSFRGRADFYEPQRALAKAQELAKPVKCLTPYFALIEQAVAGAIANDMLIGFIHTKPETGGTYYHDQQVVIASRAGLEAHQVKDAVILLGGDDGLVSFALPQTSTLTSKGNPLASKFVMQSRGEAKADAIGNSWATGVFKMQRH